MLVIMFAIYRKIKRDDYASFRIANGGKKARFVRRGKMILLLQSMVIAV